MIKKFTTNLKLFLIILFISFVPVMVYSADYLKSEKINDEVNNLNQLNNKLDILKIKQQQPTNQSQLTKNNHKLDFSSQELLSNPSLLKNLLEKAVISNNISAVKILLDIYKQSINQDPNLVLISEAILYKYNNNYKQAILNYRKVIANQPDYNVIRLDLAICLFEDHQYEAAEAQFNKVNSINTNPQQIKDLIKLYLNKIKQNSMWKFNFNMSYIQNSNVNNAPKNNIYENFKFAEPKKAKGLLYNVNVNKNINLKNNHYLKIDLYANGKYYFNKNINNKYSVNTVHSGMGWLYKNITTDLEIIPFTELSWQGKSKNRKSFGVDINFSHWFNNNIQLFNNNSWSNDKYFDRDFLNGYSSYNDLGINYLINPQLLINQKIYVNTSHSKYDDDSYKKYGIQFGITKEWNFGLSNSVILTHSQKNIEVQTYFKL